MKYGVFLKRFRIARVLLTSNSGKIISKLNTNSYFKPNLGYQVYISNMAMVFEVLALVAHILYFP